MKQHEPEAPPPVDHPPEILGRRQGADVLVLKTPALIRQVTASAGRGDVAE
jgi:hypothetical protein